MGLLQRFGQHLQTLEADELALEGDAFLGPGGQDHLDVLAETGVALLRRDGEGVELHALEAPAGAPVDPTAGQDVEQGHLLGQAQRMVGGGQGHPHTNA